MDAVKMLERDLLNKSTASLIYAARWVIDSNETVPDWVHALANGNPDHWEDVIKAAIADRKGDNL